MLTSISENRKRWSQSQNEKIVYKNLWSYTAGWLVLNCLIAIGVFLIGV